MNLPLLNKFIKKHTNEKLEVSDVAGVLVGVFRLRCLIYLLEYLIFL